MNDSLVGARTVGGACALALAAVMLAAAQTPAPAPNVKTAPQVYKNIQVLQDMPADQLPQTMRMVAASLGVTCEFCHVADRSMDDKQNKKTARMMMTMVLGINKTTFNGQRTVSCYTCHRGSNEPVTNPAIPEVAGVIVSPTLAAEDAGTKPTLPTADQILSKYVDALGGEQALRKVTSRLVTSTNDVPSGAGGVGPTLHVEAQHYFKAPNLDVQTVQAAGGAVSSGFDGTTEWSQDNKGAVHDVAGLDATRAKRAADFYEPLDLKTEYSRLIVRDIEKVRGKDAYTVVGIVQGDSPERLYFDTQTGLLVRKWTATPTPLGNSPLEVDYDDYRDVGDGVKMPFSIRTVGMSKSQELTIHVEKVQDNAPVDASKFAKPASK